MLKRTDLLSRLLSAKALLFFSGPLYPSLSFSVFLSLSLHLYFHLFSLYLISTLYSDCMTNNYILFHVPHMPIDQLLDCNRVLISELLNAPKPTFTPKRGILDTDDQIYRIIQDNTAAFYRTKLRALISGKTDSVFTDIKALNFVR